MSVVGQQRRDDYEAAIRRIYATSVDLRDIRDRAPPELQRILDDQLRSLGEAIERIRDAYVSSRESGGHDEEHCPGSC